MEENLITKAEYDEAKRTFPMAQRGQIMEGVKASLVLKKKLLEKVIGYLKTDSKGVATVLGKHAFTLDAGVVAAPNFPDSVIG